MPRTSTRHLAEFISSEAVVVKTASDTLSLSLVESAEASIIQFLASTDTLTVGITEAAANVVAVFNPTDTLSLSISAEVSTNLLESSLSDELFLIVDELTTNNLFLVLSDSLGGEIQENLSLARLFTASDSLLISLANETANKLVITSTVDIRRFRKPQ